METKLFEIRDRSTFVPVAAIRPGKIQPATPAKIHAAELRLWEAAGYGGTLENQSYYVLLIRIEGGNGQALCDPYEWASERTMGVAHRYIIDNWETLTSGDVIDVEFILGETAHAKHPQGVY